jgi:hypothetical protein
VSSITRGYLPTRTSDNRRCTERPGPRSVKPNGNGHRRPDLPCPGVNHDVLPPAIDPRPHRRPFTRQTYDAQSLLRRLQIVDPSDANPPLRHRRVLSSDTPYWTVEEDVSRPLQLSRSPHAQSHHPRHSDCHRRRCGCGWLDPHISQPRALIFGVP